MKNPPTIRRAIGAADREKLDAKFFPGDRLRNIAHRLVEALPTIKSPAQREVILEFNKLVPKHHDHPNLTLGEHESEHLMEMKTNDILVLLTAAAEAYAANPHMGIANYLREALSS